MKKTLSLLLAFCMLGAAGAERMGLVKSSAGIGALLRVPGVPHQRPRLPLGKLPSLTRTLLPVLDHRREKRPSRA